ncbi:putative heme peroxidase [Tanacetum coccineum]
MVEIGSHSLSWMVEHKVLEKLAFSVGHRECARISPRCANCHILDTAANLPMYDLGGHSFQIRDSSPDHWTQVCDVSILLNDLAISERMTQSNTGVGVHEVIDAVKPVVENICPRNVSCAHILTAASRGFFYGNCLLI